MAIPNEVKLLIACSGIFFSFSYFAVLQEDVYKKEYGGEKFKFTFLALAVERGVNALIALAGVMALGTSGCKIPKLDIFYSGISQMLAMAGSNEALRYVSFATQVRPRHTVPQRWHRRGECTRPLIYRALRLCYIPSLRPSHRSSASRARWCP